MLPFYFSSSAQARVELTRRWGDPQSHTWATYRPCPEAGAPLRLPFPSFCSWSSKYRSIVLHSKPSFPSWWFVEVRSVLAQQSAITPYNAQPIHVGRLINHFLTIVTTYNQPHPLPWLPLHAVNNNPIQSTRRKCLCNREKGVVSSSTVSLFS